MKVSLVITLLAIIFLGCSSSKKANKHTSANNNNPDTLSEKDNNSITNKYWKLIKLEGKKITMAKNQEREAFFILHPEQKTITGFSGCNSFSGNYTLEKGWRIRFSKMVSTLKACPDVEVNEHEMMKVFEMADNYSLHADTLSLNVGRRAPLAVFTSVDFH